MELQDSGGFFHLAVFFFAAFGLNFAELFQSSFELAGKAVFVAAEIRERAGLVADGGSHGEGSVGFRMSGVDGG